MTSLRPALLDRISSGNSKAAVERDLRASMREQLYRLSFHAFEHLVKELLTLLGYSNARLLGRTQWRQHTRHGGINMEAFATVGLSSAQVVLQVKQYRRTVSRQFIDELRGVVVRTGAGEGIVITTSHFSSVATMAAKSQRLAPIRLIGGEELIRLLIEHRIGTRQEEHDGENWTDVDTEFFDRMHARYPNNRLPQADTRTNAETSLLPPDGTRSPSDTRNNHPMLWRTHFLAGITSLWLLYPLPGALNQQTLPLSIGMAALGSLLPDLDAAESKLKHLGAFGITPLAPLSQLANRAFGHRGLLHSPVTLIPVAVVSAALSFPDRHGAGDLPAPWLRRPPGDGRHYAPWHLPSALQ